MRTATMIASLAVSLYLSPAIALADAPAPAKAAPEGALDAPEFFGFEVVEARRGVDKNGWPTSTTLLKASLDEIFAKLKSLFSTDTAFAPGWKIAGVGRSDVHRVVSATLTDKDGQRFACQIRSREEKVVQVELVARPRIRGGGRLAPTAPDRIPAAGGAAKSGGDTKAPAATETPAKK